MSYPGKQELVLHYGDDGDDVSVQFGGDGVGGIEWLYITLNDLLITFVGNGNNIKDLVSFLRKSLEVIEREWSEG